LAKQQTRIGPQTSDAARSRFTLLFRPFQTGTIMRTLALLAALGATMFSTAACAAPDTTTLDAGGPPMASVKTIQGAQHKLNIGDVGAVLGSYDLSDGQILRVSFEHRKLFAEVGDRKTELVAAGRNTFVTRSGDMTLVFDQLLFANEVVLTRN
jgi:hypothetical protein